MKKVILSLIWCLFFAIVTHAVAGEKTTLRAASDGYYASFHGGVAFLDDSSITDSTEPDVTLNGEFDTGYALDLAIGYKHDIQRIEGELSYQQNDFDKLSYMGESTGATGDVSAFTFLLNYYFDIPTKYALKPFITAGIGVSKVEVNDLVFPEILVGQGNEDDTVFAYQFGIGASIAVNNSVDVEIKYRYFGTEDPDFDTTSAEISSNNVLLGIRIAL